MSLTYLLFDLFCDNNNIYSQPTPPPPNSLSYIIIPKKPTYLGSMGNYLSRKAEMPTSLVDSGDCLFFTSPSPACQQSHYPTHTLPPN